MASKKQCEVFIKQELISDEDDERKEGPHHLEDFKIKCEVVIKEEPNEIVFDEKNEQFPCDLCGEKFQDKLEVLQHYKIHTSGPKKYELKCKKCSIRFMTQSGLRLHKCSRGKDAIYDDSRFACSSCDKTFLNQSSLWNHQKNHLQSNVQQCMERKMKKSKDYLQTLEKHVSMMEQEMPKLIARPNKVKRPYSCRFCQAKFSRRYRLVAHIDKHLLEKEVEKDEKPTDPLKTPDSKVLSKNVPSENDLKTSELSCLICDKTFQDEWKLKIHKWTHN